MRWLAVELFNYEGANTTEQPHHSEKTDVWAFGMTLYVRAPHWRRPVCIFKMQFMGIIRNYEGASSARPAAHFGLSLVYKPPLLHVLDMSKVLDRGSFETAIDRKAAGGNGELHS